MLDIGFTELLLVAVIALVVLGPERLPQAIRTTAYWVGKIRRSFQSVKEELEKEIDADGIKRQLHNEAVMKELNKTREQFQSQINDLKQSVGADTTGHQEDQGSSEEPSAYREPSARKELSAPEDTEVEEVSVGSAEAPQRPGDKVGQEPPSIKDKL